MLPYIVIDFFLNIQPDALVIQIYSVIKRSFNVFLTVHHNIDFFKLPT